MTLVLRLTPTTLMHVTTSPASHPCFHPTSALPRAPQVMVGTLPFLAGVGAIMSKVCCLSTCSYWVGMSPSQFISSNM